MQGASERDEHLIDCDSISFVPDGWECEEHRKGGVFKFDVSQIELHLDDDQRKGNYPTGNKLRERLKGKPALNANVLGYLLKNPQLIPEEWKGKNIYFWGTIYCFAGDLYVYGLSWTGVRWAAYHHRLVDNYLDDDFAALCRS